MFVRLLWIYDFDLILNNFLMTFLRHIMIIKRIFKAENRTVIYCRKFGLFDFGVFLYIFHVELFPLFKVRLVNLRTLFKRKFFFNLRYNLLLDFLFHNWWVFNSWRFSIKFQINNCCWKKSDYNNRYDTNNNDYSGTVRFLFLRVRVIVIENRIV